MTIFERIIAREIPAHIVWEDEHHIAFLDIKPFNPGHLLVVPKQLVATFIDMSDEAYSQLFLVVKKIAGPLQQATNATRIGLQVEGFEVDHVHVHLIPLHHPHELDPQRAREATPEALTAIAKTIRESLTHV